MSIKLHVWGDFALFTQPAFKAEKASYSAMTPSAARGILDAIYFHPGLTWVVDKIHVCKPIRYMNLRRNEVKATINASAVQTVMKRHSGTLYLSTSKEIQQRASMLLRDVEYVIEAHFVMTNKASPTDNPGKFQDIMKRRIQRGQFYHQPYFGCREFPAQFAPCDSIPPCPDDLSGFIDLGLMLYDLDFSDPQNIRPLFFHAKLQDGVMIVPARDSGEVFG